MLELLELLTVNCAQTAYKVYELRIKSFLERNLKFNAMCQLLLGVSDLFSYQICTLYTIFFCVSSCTTCTCTLLY